MSTIIRCCHPGCLKKGVYENDNKYYCRYHYRETAFSLPYTFFMPHEIKPSPMPKSNTCKDYGMPNGNPIVAKDVCGKPKVGYVMKSLMNAIAKVREYGNNKYPDGGTDNWRSVDTDDYFHALRRHVDSMCDARFNTKSRESVNDTESDMPHAWHAATNLMFIIELLDQENAE